MAKRIGSPFETAPAILEELKVELWHRLVIPAGTTLGGLEWFGSLDGGGHAGVYTPNDSAALHPLLARGERAATLPAPKLFIPTDIAIRHQAFPPGWWEAVIADSAIDFRLGERSYRNAPGSALPIALSREIPVMIPALQRFWIKAMFRESVTVPREAYVEAVLTGQLGREI